MAMTDVEPADYNHMGFHMIDARKHGKVTVRFFEILNNHPVYKANIDAVSSNGGVDYLLNLFFTDIEEAESFFNNIPDKYLFLALANS